MPSREAAKPDEVTRPAKKPGKGMGYSSSIGVAIKTKDGVAQGEYQAEQAAHDLFKAIPDDVIPDHVELWCPKPRTPERRKREKELSKGGK